MQRQAMLVRCSAVCGTEGKELHAGAAGSAALNTLSTAKTDGRKQLHAAESAAARSLSITKSRQLQVLLPGS